LTGTGITPVTLSPTSLSFGGVVIGAKSNKTVTLTNNQSVALTGINFSITGSSAYSQVNTCGTSIPAKGVCTITVSFAPTSSGSQPGTLSINNSASNSPQTVALTGSGVAPLTLTPGSLTFGGHNVGTTSAAKNITVTNHEKATVTFTSIMINGNDPQDFAETNTCTSLSPGGTCVISVTFTPTLKGYRSAVVTLTDSATNSPQSATINGTGLN
jgi:hypothetical protein